MASVFPRLLKAYRRHGLLVRTGLSPLYFNDPDAGFTHFLKDPRTPVSVGGGLAPLEIHLLEDLFGGEYSPQNVLVIGNAFGWSALALGLMLPRALVVAIDAGLEGDATAVGAKLTRRIADEEGVAVRVVDALSPRDLGRIVETEFRGAALDFVLVDGLHTNEQLTRDFEGTVPYASPECVFALHDVLHWHMLAAFNRLPIGKARERRLLTRSPSGMGIVFPTGLDPAARDAIDAYCDDTVDLAELHASLGASEQTPGPNLVWRLSRGWRHRRLGTAAVHEIEGRPDLAVTELARAALDGHEDADLQFRIAVYHLDRGRYSEAESFLTAARRLAPGWAWPPHRLARVMKEAGRYDNARSLFEEAARLTPDWALPHYEAGIVVRHLEGDAAAIPYFERAMNLAPGWAAAPLELGAIQFHLGQDVAAAANLDRVVSLEPDWAPPHHLMGLLKRRVDGAQAALGWLERAVALDPTCALSQHDLGLAQLALSDTVRARTSLERAAALAPRWAAPRFELGLIQFHCGEDAAAAASLNRSIEIEPAWGPPHHVMGLLERRRGNLQIALGHLERAVALDADRAKIGRAHV